MRYINTSGMTVYATNGKEKASIDVNGSIKVYSLDGQEKDIQSININEWTGSFDSYSNRTDFPLNKYVEDKEREQDKNMNIQTTWDANTRVANTVIPNEHYEKEAKSIASEVEAVLTNKVLKVEVQRQPLDESETAKSETGTNRLPYSDEDFNRDTILPDDYTLNDLKTILKIKHFMLFVAPPGTGKTTAAINLANTLLHETNSERLKFISFNQTTEYSDVVCGLHQDVDGVWRNKDGILKSLCTKALNDSENLYILVIDEINRGNTEALLGEYLTAMSKIGLPVTCNSGDKIVMPSNLYIIATMNTVDSSISQLDAATRDRFAIVKMIANRFEADAIKPDAVSELKSAINMVIDGLDRINNILAKDAFKGKDNTIGMRQLYTDYSNKYELGLTFKTCLIPQIEEAEKNLEISDIEDISDIIKEIKRDLEI